MQIDKKMQIKRKKKMQKKKKEIRKKKKTQIKRKKKMQNACQDMKTFSRLTKTETNWLKNE
jgi:hypothetical protein